MSKLNWDANFYRGHQCFQALYATPFADFSRQEWPTVQNYNDYCRRVCGTIINGNNIEIEFTLQGNKDKQFEKQYEPMIFLEGKILTRSNNWHDFFNMLVWTSFMKSKACINTLQYNSLKARLPANRHRTPLENALTLFDENGIVIVSSDISLLELIKNARWKTLFWDYREQVKKHVKVYVFGHALYEKLLNPYIGLCGGSLLFSVEENFHEISLDEQKKYIDLYIENTLHKNRSTITPKTLYPFPLLGFPGYDNRNEILEFYMDTNYFRCTNKS